MNLERIQSKLPDIEQMRSISAENETTMQRWKGRNGTDQEEAPISSLSFRFLIAGAALAFLIYADYHKLPGTGELLTRFDNAISQNIKSEDMENLEDIWYTISNAIHLPGNDRADKEGQDVKSMTGTSESEEG